MCRVVRCLWSISMQLVIRLVMKKEEETASRILNLPMITCSARLGYVRFYFIKLWYMPFLQLMHNYILVFYFMLLANFQSGLMDTFNSTHFLASLLYITVFRFTLIASDVWFQSKLPL